MRSMRVFSITMDTPSRSLETTPISEEALADGDDTFMHEMIGRIAQLFLNVEGVEAKPILDLEKTKTIFDKIRSTLDLEAALLKGEERGEAGGPCVSSAGAVVPKSLGPDFYNREQYFKVYDAFSGKEKAINLALPDISLKREYYRNFYDLLTQRVMRSEFIRTRTILNSGLPPITKIGSLKGQLSGSYLLIGMLTQFEEDKLHLDDLTSSIELAFDREFEMTRNVFTLSSIVLIEGVLTEAGKIAVFFIGMPTLPPLNESLWMGNWARNLNVDYESLKRNFRKICVDAYVIILSDVWLDRPEVLSALKKMFARLSSPDAVCPYAIIMCGNFCFTGYSYSLSGKNEGYTSGFTNLANILKQFSNLSQNTHFVFVPGKSDPWCPDFLPRPGIPQAFVNPLERVLKNVHFSSNPSRISCFFQNIIIFRQNMVNALCQNAVLPPKFSNEHTLDFIVASTVLDQSNLSPIPLSSSPVLWGAKNCLCIDTPPDFLVLADSYECYITRYQNVICANPGPFMNSGFSFVTYQLYNKECNISRVSMEAGE